MKEIIIVVTCCAGGIMYVVLLISHKDYVLYKIRINIVFARHTVIGFSDGGLSKLQFFHLYTCTLYTKLR